MKIQTKKLLFSLAAIGSIAGGTIGGTVAYGKLSPNAKGWSIKASQSQSDFMLGDEFTDEYDYKFINNLGEVDKTIGKYIPPKKDSNKESYGVVESEGKKVPVEEFIKNFRKENDGQYPLFTIKSSYFTFDNRYLAAVSADDWAKLAFWFLGDSKTPGKLSYGPEAGIVSSFQIVSGVEHKSGSVTLGNYGMAKKERGMITFFPDAFFGNFQIYSPFMGQNKNRLADYFYGQELTIDEAKRIIETINKTMQYAEKDPNPKIKKDFGIKGESVPRPLSLVPGNIELSSDGKRIQKYKILSEFFTARYDDPSGKSLLEKVGTEFPELLTSSTGYYVDKNKNGLYEVKYGENKSWNPQTRIGLPQILKAANPDFNGFGIDFLKYVAIHEFGHHQTLINAGDLSEGGYITGAVSSKTGASVDGLNNLQVLNDYLAARSSGLQAVPTKPYGKEFATEDERIAAESPYFSFRMPNGDLEKYEGIVGNFEYDLVKKKWVPSNTNSTPYRAFKESLEDLQQNYVDKYNKNHPNKPLHAYDVYIMNSFDSISGTLNPSTSINTSARDLYKTKTSKVDNTFSGQDIFNFWKKYTIWVWNANGVFQKNLEITPKAFYDSLITPTTDKLVQNRIFIKENKAKRNGKNLILIEAQLEWIKEFFKDEASVVGKADKILKFIQQKIDSFGIANSTNLEKLAKEFVSKNPINSIADVEKFYDSKTKKWVKFEIMIKNSFFDSDPQKPKPVLKDPNDKNNPDLDLTTFGFVSTTVQNGKYQFDLIYPEKILDKNGKSWFEYWKEEIKPSNKNPSNKNSIQDDLKKAKKSYIDQVLSPIIKILFNIYFGHKGEYISQSEGGRRPEYVDFHFPDYVYNYPEVMTRDLVQISLPQEQSFLSNTNPFLSMTQSGTSFEYFVDKELTKAYDPNNPDTHVNKCNGLKFIKIMKEYATKNNDSEAEYISNNLNINLFFWDQNINENDFLYRNKFMSNGYEKDRQQRELLGWSLYNADGRARKIEPRDGINITHPRDNSKPKSWAEAYWYFLLKMRGIGNRNVTGIFRDPDLDLLYTYGFMDLKDPNLQGNKQKPEFLAFKNTSTGKVIYKKIYYQNQDTLFYLTHQGDDDSRHSVKDEDYVGWSTNRFSAGQYVNEDLTLGEYEVYFANSDWSRSKVLFTTGSREYIAENGKFYKQAPTLFEKQTDGSVIYKVKTRFNGG